MKLVMGREKYFLLAMAILSVLLAGVLLWEWQQGMVLKSELLKLRKIPVTALPPQKILPEYSLANLETGFPELLKRPVFSVSRRAFVAAAQADAGAMKKGQFVLVGVMISPRQRSALLRDVATGKTQSVAQVGVVRGMTVSQVLPGRVMLLQGDETEELLLNVQTGAKRVALPPTTTSAPSPPVSAPAVPVSAPRLPPGGAIPGTAPIPSSASPAALPASVPRPQTAQELIQAEKQQQSALDKLKKQAPSVPVTPPPATSR